MSSTKGVQCARRRAGAELRLILDAMPVPAMLSVGNEVLHAHAAMRALDDRAPARASACRLRCRVSADASTIGAAPAKRCTDAAPRFGSDSWSGRVPRGLEPPSAVHSMLQILQSKRGVNARDGREGPGLHQRKRRAVVAITKKLATSPAWREATVPVRWTPRWRRRSRCCATVHAGSQSAWTTAAPSAAVLGAGKPAAGRVEHPAQRAQAGAAPVASRCGPRLPKSAAWLLRSATRAPALRRRISRASSSLSSYQAGWRRQRARSRDQLRKSSRNWAARYAHPTVRTAGHASRWCYRFGRDSHAGATAQSPACARNRR